MHHIQPTYMGNKCFFREWHKKFLPLLSTTLESHYITTKYSPNLTHIHTHTSDRMGSLLQQVVDFLLHSTYFIPAYHFLYTQYCSRTLRSAIWVAHIFFSCWDFSSILLTHIMSKAFQALRTRNKIPKSSKHVSFSKRNCTIVRSQKSINL